jgi:hypothetical protein
VLIIFLIPSLPHIPGLKRICEERLTDRVHREKGKRELVEKRLMSQPMKLVELN